MSPGCFPECVMLGMKPELSEAVGEDHVICVDVLPLSAVATMCDEQFENTGGDTSKNGKRIDIKTKQKQNNKNHNNISHSDFCRLANKIEMMLFCHFAHHLHYIFSKYLWFRA